jgi:ribokinase
VAPGKHGARALSGVFVLGNASIDVTLNVPRLPDAGETLMASGIARAPGGKGLNQAVAAARAGAAVHFCAPVGREPETAMLHAALAREPFASLRLIEGAYPTDLSTLIVAADGENIIISTGDCADGLTDDDARAFVAGLQSDDWLLVQGNLTEAATWAAVSRAGNVVFNTAPIRWKSRRLQAASAIVVANQGEARAITGLDDPASAAAALGGRAGIVTLGAAGCVLSDAGRITHFPAPRVAAVDSTGAGDTFCGVLTAFLAAGLSIDLAIGQAQKAAALTVSRAGCFAALPSIVELHDGSGFGVVIPTAAD